MQNKLKLDFFPYGTQYYRYPTPRPDEWEKDLRELARQNYTHVQFRPQWREIERCENNYEWDSLDRLMDLAEANHLKVVIQLMLECAPDWIFSRYHGSRVGFRGQVIPQFAHGAFYVGGWLPCFDNPEVAKHGNEFAYQTAKRYGTHSSLWFFDAWNEPRSRPAGQCCCDHSRRSYQAYLRQKFGTVEALNATWGKAWSSFETIVPPESANDYAEMFLWRQWAAHAVSEHVRNVFNGIKRAMPDLPVMNHVGAASVIADSVFDSTNDLENAAATDFYGCSFPVWLHPKNLIENATSNLIGDWLRRVDPGFWIHEFYPMWGNWTRPCESETLNRLLWQAFATGPSGFTFWQYRSERVGNECYGFGLREINGDPTVRSRICDKISDKMQEFGSRLADTRVPRAEVAQVYNQHSDLISRIQCCGCHLMADEPIVSPDDFYKQFIAGAHALYDRQKDGVDFVTPDDDFSSYRTLVLAGEEMVSGIEAERLREFVCNGGNLIVEFPFATRDDNTWIAPDRPNHRLVDLLGFQERFRWVAEGERARIHDCEVPAVRWTFTGEPADDTEVIGHWATGEAAALRHPYGKGQVFTLLAAPSIAYNRDPDPQLEQLAGLLLNACGISVLPPGLSWKRRESATETVNFFFNLGTRPVRLPFLPDEIWDENRRNGNHLEVNGFLVGATKR